ncbi:hypothetical protein Amet_1832 [Alkaliphilus metalliredigens QYMF]|uniref:Glutaredoxin n=1 Tax=Alkaliphilus metalliredigens (strain QYMF) TaxID=293826 RepID=A6TP84_ALKMQ|nr:hypothetical protein [Alkaliphilus metalliredigens]ABR48002.1 hypothetical protein Amet_1832 [Alkaliphilus metalliredigens QYMF]
MEMYDEVNQFLRNTDMKDKYEMAFIDVIEDDLSGYEKVKEMLDKGYQLPLTLVAGRAAFAGKVDNEKLYQILKRI